MGQIIKSVCVCQSVCLSVFEHSHGRISWSIFTIIGTDVRTPKSKKMLSYRRETALQGALVLAKRRRHELREIIGLSSTTMTKSACKAIEIGEKKRKLGLIRRSRSFKVTEVGINRKPVCDFLLVINSNWHPISYRFGIIAAYCSNFGQFAFFSHPLGA